MRILFDTPFNHLEAVVDAFKNKFNIEASELLDKKFDGSVGEIFRQTSNI